MPDLLQQVRQRLGGRGHLSLELYGDSLVRAEWSRYYPRRGLSDERALEAATIDEALRGIIAHEDAADLESGGACPAEDCKEGGMKAAQLEIGGDRG